MSEGQGQLWNGHTDWRLLCFALSFFTRSKDSELSPLLTGGVGGGVVMGGVVGRLDRVMCLGRGPGFRFLRAGEFGSCSLASRLLRLGLLPPAAPTAMPGIASSASSIIRFYGQTERHDTRIQTPDQYRSRLAVNRCTLFTLNGLPKVCNRSGCVSSFRRGGGPLDR
mgnify:CR=1 FL=1